MRLTTAALLMLLAPVAATGSLAQMPDGSDASPLQPRPDPSEPPISDLTPMTPGGGDDARPTGPLQPNLPPDPGPPGTGRVPTDTPAGHLSESEPLGPESDTPVPPGAPEAALAEEATAWIGLPVLSVGNEVVGTVHDVTAGSPGGPAERLVIERRGHPGGLISVPVAEVDAAHEPRSVRLRLSTAEVAAAPPFAYTDEVQAEIDGTGN